LLEEANPFESYVSALSNTTAPSFSRAVEVIYLLVHRPSYGCCREKVVLMRFHTLNGVRLELVIPTPEGFRASLTALAIKTGLFSLTVYLVQFLGMK